MAEDITTQEVEQVDNTQQQLPEQPPKKLSVKDFAARIKEKYPEYNSVADDILVNKMIEKYPVYQDQVDMPQKKNDGQPSKDGGQTGTSPTQSPSQSQLPKVKWEENPLNPLAAANKAQEQKEQAAKIMPQPTPTVGKKATPIKAAPQRKSIAEAPKEGEGFLSTVSQMAFAPLSKDYVKYFYNQILGGIGEISSSASDLVMQGLVNVLPEEALGGTKDEVLGQWRNEAEPIVREGIKQQVGAKLPKEKEAQFDNNLVTGAVGGIGKMIPAMVSPYKAGIFLQAYDNGIKSVNDSEVGKNLPESVKTIWGTANGVIMKTLMDFQLDKIFGKQAPQIASKITANIFEDLLKNTEGTITKEAFETAANNTVKGLKNKIISTGGNLAKTGLESTLLGTGFGAIDVASKKILNKATGQKVFDKTSLEVPKDLSKVFDANSWGDGWGEILHSGASMGIQGLTMRGAFIPFANTDNYIKSEVAKAKTPEDINSLKTEIISQVNEGKISPEDAQRVSDTIDKYVNINSKIPADVTDRERAIDLVEQKDDLKQAATDKLNETKVIDEAFHPQIQQEATALLNRANELNKEITGEPSEPVKHSMYADPLELPELKEQIDDINRRIDLGGADGEKAKQELIEIKTDPIKFYENRKQSARENLTEETALNQALETYDNIINKIKQYDKENESRLSGSVGVGEKPVEAKPIEGGGAQEISSSGVLQAPGAEGEGKGVEGKVGEKVAVPTVKDFTKQIEPNSSTIKTVAGDKAYNYINKDGVEVTLKEDEDGGYVNGNQVQADVHLDFIGNDTKRGEGLASKELDRIIAQADKNDMSISLVVDSDQAVRGTTSEKGLSDKELKKWYESKGFIFDKNSRFGYRPKATEDASIYKKPEYIAKKGEITYDNIGHHSSPEDLQEAFDQDRLKEGTFHEDGTGDIYKVEDGKLKEVKNAKEAGTYEKGIYIGKIEYSELPEQKEAPKEEVKAEVELPKQEGVEKVGEKVEPIQGVEQEQVIKQMKPFTDKMVDIEREFNNNGYEINTDYDNEIQVLDKKGEQVEPDELPDNLKKLAADYEKATMKLGDFDASAREKALAESRKVVETEAEVVESKKAELPEQKEQPVGKKKRKASDMAIINRVDAKKVYQEVYATDEPVDAIGAAQRWLATGNKINEESFAKEVSGYIKSKGQAKTYMPKDVKISEFTSPDKKLPSINKAAHDIWESLPEHIQENISDQDIRDALIDQLQQYSKRVDIAKDYLQNYSPENAVEKYYKDIEERENVAFEKEMKDLNEWMQQTGEEEGKLRLDEDYVNNLIKQYEEESRNEPRPIEGEDKGVAKGEATRATEEVSGIEGTRQKEPAEPKPAEVEPPVPPTISKQGTLEGGEGALKGITMADNAMRRDEIGMPERMPNPETVEQWRAEAEKKIADGYNINDLIEKMERGEQTDKVENEISRIFAATLDAEVKKNPSNENIDAYERLIKAREKSSSEIGRALRSLQGLSNPFENISDFYVAKKEANKVDNLTDAQKAEVKKDFENIQKAKDEYEKKWKEAEAKFAEMQAQNELLRQQKESKKYTKEGKRDFTAERKDLKEQLKNEIQKYKNNTQKLGISSNGGASDFAITVEMAKIIGKIAKSHVEEVGAKLSEVTQRTFDDVKDLFDGITTKDIHDVIAGKYSERKETKSELLSNLRQIQSEAKLLNELDRVLAGEPKNEKQKVEKNQKLADLRRQINDIKKSGGLEEYSDEARAKKAIEANKKKEEKIKERLANNDFDPETKRESIYDSKEFKSKNPKLYKELLDSQVKKQEAELEFHKKLVENEMANMGKVDKFKQIITKARGTLKAIYAGIDDSAVGVQNWFQAIVNPSIGARAVKDHVLDFWSQKRFDRNIEELHNSPDWNMMKESGLQVSEPKSLLEAGKEEMFPDRFKAIIKIKGKEYGWINIGGKKYEIFDVLKPFERAFTSLGNSLRVIKFRTEAEKMYEKGITFEKNPEEFKKLATRINAMTSASKPNEAFKSDIVNMAIWSPRLMASKLNILGISDLASYTPLVKNGYYRSLGEKGKILSKQQLYAAADLAKFATAVVAGSYLFASARGGQLNTNPEDSKFMDVELPNGKSYNFTGGFSKYISTLYQIARGGKVNKMTGEFEEYKGFKDRGSEVLHFLRGKMPPISGSIVSVATKKDYLGKPANLYTEVEKYKMPMAVGQIYDQIQKDGYSSLFGEGIPTFLGINVGDKRDYMETGLFTKEDISRPELKTLTDKGLSIPKLSVKETYKVKRDEAHPEGVMTDDEYKELSTKVHDYMINGWEDEDGNMENGIKDLLNISYNVQTYTEADEEEPSKEETVLGKDLPIEQLKNKLSNLKDKAVKKAIEDMGLTKKSKIIVKEEE